MDNKSDHQEIPEKKKNTSGQENYMLEIMV